jgi:hypothetical protein
MLCNSFRQLKKSIFLRPFGGDAQATPPFCSPHELLERTKTEDWTTSDVTMADCADEHL